MSEECKVDYNASDEAVNPKTKFRKKRDIFRFNGSEDMSIDLGHVYKMVRKERRITFQTAVPAPTADFVEFETEDAAKNAYDQILTVWGNDVVE